MAILTTPRTKESTQDSSTASGLGTGRSQVDERPAVRRIPRSTVVPNRETSEMPAITGPRPRASMLATLSLMLGLGSVFAVLTGLLAGVGVGLGLLATFAAIGGIAATSRHHVAGKGDAVLGMILGLASIVVGSLAMTGSLPWLDPGTDQVLRLHDWLDVRMPWLFPNP